MTSDAPVQLVNRLFDAFTRRDAGALDDLITLDMEFFGPTADMVRGGAPYVGREGMREYLDDVARVWRELRVIPQSFRVEGDRVLATGRVYARDHEGSIIDSPAGWIFTVGEDRVLSGRVYARAEDAVAAFDAGS